MKGIELCAECAYYNMKSHKCTRGYEIESDRNKGEDVRFFVDCPLPDVQSVKYGKVTFVLTLNKPDFCQLCDARMIKDGDAE